MAGKTIQHYQVIEQLGVGGMGEIYKAQDTRLNRFVAIKMLPATMSANQERRRRFVQEAQAASALNHPNIITIYDIVDDGDAQCMVMEFIAGKTLHDLTSTGGLPVPLVLQYGAQIAGALAAAHAAGIVHRDLKPSNIMITQSGLVKVLDFGLAKLTDPSPTSQLDHPETVDQGPLTQEGAIIGTVNYMSPEQAEGKPVDARSDIFSFGSVLYEMVTGRRAFDEGSSLSTLWAVLRDEVKPFSELAPGAPPQLEAIVTRCLPKDPGARWQAMQDVEDALSGLKRQFDSDALRSTSQTTLRAPAPSEVRSSEARTVAAPSSDLHAPADPPPPPVSSSPDPVTVVALQPGSSPKNLGLGLILAGLVIGAAAGGWWWWNHQSKPAPQQSAQAPPQTAAPAPAATAPEIPPPAPVAPAPAAKTTLNNAAILDLLQVNTPASEIVKRIRSSKTNFNVSSEELNRLKQAGVPDSVIQAMRNPTGVATPPAPSTAVAPPPLPSPPSVSLVPVAVSDALPFSVILAVDVHLDAQDGQPLLFTVVDNVKVNDSVVIAKGATVTGSVAGETGGKKILGIGRGNKLTFRLLLADAVDGRKLNVRCMRVRRAEGPTVRSFDTTKASKTKGLAAPQGADFIAYIDGDQIVSAHK